jgi:hypothetical protein
MKRALILTPIILIVACVALFLSGYGIRTAKDPIMGSCDYFIGIGQTGIIPANGTDSCRLFRRVPSFFP